MLVDSEGRAIPYGTDHKPFVNQDGHITDENGSTIPAYERHLPGNLVHEDDIRVAVVATDISNEINGENLFFTSDGQQVPRTISNDIVVGQDVNGIKYVYDLEGNEIELYDRIVPFGSYRNPVEIYNQPLSEGETMHSDNINIDEEEPSDPLLPIESLVESNRPTKAGIQFSRASVDEFADDETDGLEVQTGYDYGRFYTTSEDAKYKYWSSPSLSSVIASSTQLSGYEIDEEWNFNGNLLNLSPNDITIDRTDEYTVLGRVMNLEENSTYHCNVSFSCSSKTNYFKVQVIQWDDEDSTNSAHNSSVIAFEHVVSLFNTESIGSNDISFDFVTRNLSKRQQIRLIAIDRENHRNNNELSFESFEIEKRDFKVEDCGPTVYYDRPVPANRLKIGMELSTQDVRGRNSEVLAVPSKMDIFTLVDSGNGLYEWSNVKSYDSASEVLFDTDANGKLIIEIDGEEDIMGFSMQVYRMSSAGARVSLNEMSSRANIDLTDRLIEYSSESSTSERSVVLPFGSVSSNSANIYFSNNDGFFSETSEYLIENTTGEDDLPVFSDIRNRFFGYLKAGIRFNVFTGVRAAGSEEEYNYTNMFYMRVVDKSPSSEYVVTFGLKDSSHHLQSVDAPEFYINDSDGVSPVEVIYTLLDMIGFTSVIVDYQDLQDTPLVHWYWTSKENSVWDEIVNICTSFQITAFFDSEDNLRFKSLNKLFSEGVSKEPKIIVDSVGDESRLANVISIDGMNTYDVNKLTTNFSFISNDDVNSGIPVMQPIWEPDGTELLRSTPLKRIVDGDHILISSESAKTFPYESNVLIDTEYMSLKGKRYVYYRDENKSSREYIYSLEEKQEIDKKYPRFADFNYFDGRLKIEKRGIFDSKKSDHSNTSFHTTERRRRIVNGNIQVNNTNGVKSSNSNSRMRITTPPGWKNNKNVTLVASRGSGTGIAPDHFGASVRIDGGTEKSAGICFGLGSQDTGLYLEIVPSTKREESGSNWGEMALFSIKNDVKGGYPQYLRTHNAPIYEGVDHKIDINVVRGAYFEVRNNLTRYRKYRLNSSSRGSVVKTLQYYLNKNYLNKLKVDGVYGRNTKLAVAEMQLANGLTPDGLMDAESWDALGGMAYRSTDVTIQIVVDGNYRIERVIPESELPPNFNSGRWGVFTKGKTDASFDYVYAYRDIENFSNHKEAFYDKLTGGYDGDVLWNEYIYERANVYKEYYGKKKLLLNMINEQLYFNDFGPHVREVRDYDITYESDIPSDWSSLYFSNRSQVKNLGFTYSPHGCKFRLINKSRSDAVLNGQDTDTFDSNNTVDQLMVVYGRLPKVSESKTIVTKDNASIRQFGESEVNISSDWIQSDHSANVLSLQFMRFLSEGFKSWSAEVFGNPYLKAGDIVSLRSPGHGVGGNEWDRDSSNRYFIASVNQNNNGSHSTSIEISEIVGDRGKKRAEVERYYSLNNNNLIENQFFDRFENNGSGITASDVVVGSRMDSGTDVVDGKRRFYIQGSTRSESTDVDRGFGVYLGADGVQGRASLQPTDEYRVSVSVTAAIQSTRVKLILERYNSSGYMYDLDSKTVQVPHGSTKRIELSGIVQEANPEIQSAGEYRVRVVGKNYSNERMISEKKLYMNDAYFIGHSIYDLSSNMNPIYGFEDMERV